ncbi:MAG: ribonuclease P protein component [Proteobacteria bacterium]|nr:ribonuclease P protein component [Pseudomonadota bacterium]
MAPVVPRLKRRSEFLRVAGARRKAVVRGLILQARRHAASDRNSGPVPPIRVGFTVSRKVGNAVARNRARRRLRAAVELVMPAHAKGGHDFVVIGRAETLKRPFAALVADLKAALERLDAIDDGAGKGGSTMQGKRQ